MLYFTSAFDINYCHVNFDETVLPQCRQRTAGDSNVNIYCIYLVQHQGEPGEAHILTGHTITTTLSLSSHWENVYTLDKYSVHPFIQIKYFAIFCLQLSFVTLTWQHTQINNIYICQGRTSRPIESCMLLWA